MRLIGNVDTKQQAEKISAYLMTHDISTHCERENGDQGEAWDIWVRDEDQIDRAKEFLAEFRQEPNHERYRLAVDEAQRIAREEEKKLQQARANYIKVNKDRWQAPITKVAPFTVALVAISVIVFVFLTNFGTDFSGAGLRALTFTSINEDEVDKLTDGDVANGWDNRLRFANIANGEIWRLITPIFIHFNIFHIAFNMFMLVYFARQIEYRYTSGRLALMVVGIAVLSNMVQCLVPEAWDGAGLSQEGNYLVMKLGGMSGVVYGLFGYVWMKMTFDPKSDLHVSFTTILILMVWMVACMAPGFFINVANWAHGVGLVTGMIIGYFPKLLSDLGVKRD